MDNAVVLDCQQRSPQWFAARLGRVTSSCASEMCATVKDPKKEAADRRNLRLRLVLERLTGRPQERSGYVSAAMQQGIDREFDALAMYEAISGRLAERVGFIQHTGLMAGGSPDGVVGDWEGIVEAKCPLPATHLETIRTGRIASDYLWQIQHLLWLTQAEWCDFISWSPEFPEKLQTKLIRVTRTEADTAAYTLLLTTFLSEVEREHAEVAALNGAAA